MYSYKRQTRTLASPGRTVLVSKANTRLASISTSSLIRAKACRRSGEAKTGAHSATASVGSHTIITATMGCRFSKEKRAPTGPGRVQDPDSDGIAGSCILRKAFTQLTRSSLRESRHGRGSHDDTLEVPAWCISH